MKTGSPAWQQLIEDGATAMGVRLGAGQTRKFSDHALALETWNRKINLTAVTDPVNVAVRHFIDSLAPVPFISKDASILDVGSGAGFPGIPIKVALPFSSVLLIDSSRKKVNFQRHVIRTLVLKDIKARQVRAEELAGNRRFFHAFDVIVSRAVTVVETLLPMTVPMLKQNGLIVGFRGRIGVEDNRGGRFSGWNPLEPIVTEAGSFSVTENRYSLPGSESDRSLVILKKVPMG